MTIAQTAPYLTLAVVLVFASFWDIKYGKIPNWLNLAAFLIGICFGIFSGKDMIFRVITAVILFFLGMIPIAGMGDIKLWIASVLMIGVMPFLWILLLACIILILYCIVRDRKGSWLIIRGMMFKFLSHNFYLTDQKGYPFAPFFLAGFLLYCIGRAVTYV